MDMQLLETKIDESGYTKLYISKQLGITRYGLYNKLKNPERWKVIEMTTLIKLLSLSRSDSKRIFGN